MRDSFNVEYVRARMQEVIDYQQMTLSNLLQKLLRVSRMVKGQLLCRSDLKAFLIAPVLNSTSWRLGQDKSRDFGSARFVNCRRSYLPSASAIS